MASWVCHHIKIIQKHQKIIIWSKEKKQ